jgi:hypothetical protein
MPILENQLHKGDYAIAHIQSSGYSLLAGTFHYSRFFVVKVTKATREGEVKEFQEYEGGCAKRVDRKTTIYAYPEAFKGTEAAAFAKQEACGAGYHDKAELKSALEALRAMEPA